ARDRQRHRAALLHLVKAVAESKLRGLPRKAHDRDDTLADKLNQFRHVPPHPRCAKTDPRETAGRAALEDLIRRTLLHALEQVSQAYGQSGGFAGELVILAPDLDATQVQHERADPRLKVARHLPHGTSDREGEIAGRSGM